MHAHECSRQDNTFNYDLCVFGSDGYVHELWEGLQLRAVADKPIQGPCDESLMGPYIERRMQELIPGTAISVAFVRSAETDRQRRSDGAIQIALREKTEVLRRPDGKPEVCFGHFVSASHARDLTLAIAGPDPVGCDIERVVDRTVSQWLDLLGENRFALANFVAKNLDEALTLAATRIWTATEALTKVGIMTDAPIRLDSLHATDWALFSSGSFKIASLPMQIRDNAEKLVLSVVTQLVSGK